MNVSIETTGHHVCIVGAGPAGMVLSCLLVHQGIPVTLLEGMSDFNRDFRGDTLHASSLEILDQMGLADAILDLSHARIDKLEFESIDGSIVIAEFGSLKTHFPFVALIPQERFLDYLATQAQRFSNFHLQMNARVHDLLYKDGKVCGVKYSHNGTNCELFADLVIGADGRGSVIRRRAGLELEKSSPPMDVIWFTLPKNRNAQSARAAAGRFGSGTMLVRLDRGDKWQMGYVILKGSYKILREQGLQTFRKHIAELMPEMVSSLPALTDWSQCAILSVVTGCVKQWHKPGLLLIGDAAHVMSPVGGVGINYAIQDAAAVFNVLQDKIASGTVTNMDLARVQRRRERPIRFIQGIQSLIQKQIIANALVSDRPFHLPLAMRIFSKFKLFRMAMARILAYGIQPEKLDTVQLTEQIHK
jgi:2-polyprenyl-6-methoxyphenol hydroxylase-like FAD-dependent oxidoreductase